MYWLTEHDAVIFEYNSGHGGGADKHKHEFKDGYVGLLLHSGSVGAFLQSDRV